MPFEGERYSLVFFCANSWLGATKSQKTELEALGFRAPEKKCLELMRAGCGIYRPVLASDHGKYNEPSMSRRFVMPPPVKPGTPGVKEKLAGEKVPGRLVSTAEAFWQNGKP